MLTRLRVYDLDTDPYDLVQLKDDARAIYDGYFDDISEAEEYRRQHYPHHPYWMAGQSGLKGRVGWGH